MSIQWIKEAQALAGQISRDRQYLHAHAEVGFELEETLRYVSEQLEGMGVTPVKCGRCGVTATIGRGERVMLLRADMDALPIREESGEPFACTTGRMHACGHDMHTAMLLGAARMLKAHEDQLPGVVKLMFQPAEEPLQGAADMIAAGVLENPSPQAAAMIHVLTGQPIPNGTVIVSSPGVSAPAANMFTIRIQGKGCHGAMPHTGVDPINAAAHMVLALQSINAREIAPADTAMLTIGMLQAGDTANVIPDTALLKGSLRAVDDDTHALMKRRVEEIAVLTAKTFRCTAEVEFPSGCPTLRNDEALSALALTACRDMLGPEKALLSGEMGGAGAKSSGSEDFANISHEVPSVMLALAAGEPQRGFSYPTHHPQCRFDEAALPIGAAVYAQVAWAYLNA